MVTFVRTVDKIPIQKILGCPWVGGACGHMTCLQGSAAQISAHFIRFCTVLDQRTKINKQDQQTAVVFLSLDLGHA